MSEILQEALAYAELGLSVIPLHNVIKGGRCSCGSLACSAIAKHPRVMWRSSQNKTLSPDNLTQWWKRHPEANVGIVTGKISQIAVLDIDGEEGLESLERIGLTIDSMPLTPMSHTGGGGIHLIFRYPEKYPVKTKAGVLPKVDIRSDGGMIVAPPSLHKSKKRYRWEEGRSIFDIDPADFDWNLLDYKPEGQEEIADKVKKSKWFEELIQEGASEGGRNDSATRLAGRWFGLGLTKSEVSFFLLKWNEKNDPPLPDKELERTMKSVNQRESDPKADPEAIRERVSDLLRLTLRDVIKLQGDDSIYVLEFEEGTCRVSNSDLLSPAGFEKAISEGTKRIPRRLGQKTTPTHSQLAQMILTLSKDAESGPESTWTGEVAILLREYLLANPTIPDGDKIPRKGPFSKDGKVWVDILDLIHMSGARWGVRMQMKPLAQKLTSLKLVSKRFEGESTVRDMWGIDPRLMHLGREENAEDEE